MGEGREMTDNNHFVGDGTGEVRWHRGNVDLDRFREEMDAIGYDFVVVYGPAAPVSGGDRLKRLAAKLRTARKKLRMLNKERPFGNRSDRAWLRHMEQFFDQLDKVEKLQAQVKLLSRLLSKWALVPHHARATRFAFFHSMVYALHQCQPMVGWCAKKDPSYVLLQF